MRQADHKWILTSFGVLSFAVLSWIAPTVIENFSDSGAGVQTERSTFATITAQQSSEIYLKDSRAFIFSRTQSNQNLKLHDSVLVGPKSEATLMLSDEFGGGEIRLAANTIITLSRAGHRNEIPRIHIKQGEIKIIAAPLKVKAKQEAQQVAQADSVAVSSSAAVTNMPSTPKTLELPGVLITGGQQAVVFDESLTNTELSIGETTKNLEVKVVAAPSKAEITESRDEDLAQQDTSEEVSPAPSYTISTISLEAIEEISLESQTLSEAVAQIEAPEPATTFSSLTREPAEETQTETYDEAEQVDAEVQEEIPEQATEVATTETIDAEPEPEPNNEAPNTAPVPEQAIVAEQVPAPEQATAAEQAPEQVHAPIKSYPFEISSSLAMRSYQDSTGTKNSTDLDIVLKGETEILENFKVAALAKITALNIKKPDTGAPRPMGLSAEAKYQFSSRNSLWLVAGYAYNTSTNNGSTVSYENLYAPNFGFDLSSELNSDKVLFAPRFSILAKDNYTLNIPVTFYWSPRWGAVLSYELIQVKAVEQIANRFQTLATSIRWKF